jgi:nitrogen fixation/metabolism regulation signal transduction histidine kinase
MATKTLRRFAFRSLLIAGALLWGSSLYLLAETTQNWAQFSRTHEAMLLINVVGALVLLVLIGGNLVRLARDYRQLVPGSRLRTRMVTMFSVLAVLPVLVVFYFSVQFLNRGIESWFNVEIDEGLSQALELSRTALELRKREYMERTRAMSGILGRWPDSGLVQEMSLLRRENGALEVTIASVNNRIIATSSERAGGFAPIRQVAEILFQTRQGLDYVRLEPMADGGYVIVTAAPLMKLAPGTEARVLIVEYPVPERLSRLADGVLLAYDKYGELKYLRQPLKTSFTLTLSLVLFLALLLAINGAFLVSRILLAPIPDLLAGTRAVAKGDFDLRLPQQSRDELGFLVDSFNDMTRKLARAREEALHHEHQVEAERSRLAIILARLSTGVISMDRGMVVHTANQAAGAILGVELENSVGQSLPELARNHPLLRQFVEAVEPQLRKGRTEWREQIALRGEFGSRVIIFACSALPGESDNDGGVVVVFDDITALLQGQRDAAWGEVARRLAHEIKNPLTPIQLSAERLRRKYLESMGEEEGQVLDRATHIIVQQVEAMKEMVDAFRDYARAPDLDLAMLDVNEIVMEVGDLYRARDFGITLYMNLDREIPPVEADRGRLRQILHNLIRNSMEALSGSDQGEIHLMTRLRQAEDYQAVELTVEDNGPGFDMENVNRLFDPYVTSKPKGTGLGLAIVKKLIEEHGGTIDARNRESGGARIEIVLPLNEASRNAMMPRLLRR